MKIFCLLLAFWITFSLVACGNTPIADTTDSGEVESTSEETPPSIPDEPLPDMMLNDTDTVTDIKYINGVRLCGGDETLYDIRCVLLDVESTEFTGKACYFDAIDPSTNTLIAYKRIVGASTLCYAINEKNFLTIWVTSVSYRPENGNLTVRSDPFDLRCLSALGESITPSFLVLANANMFSKGGMNDPRQREMLQNSILNFLETLCNRFDQGKERYTYLMSNDPTFLDHCDGKTPSMTLLADMWNDMDSIQAIMEFYGII